ncbi:MAG: HD domain-containing protein [Treponema sp.]|nr:HD domain-containing protein [Treponema sp.]
MGAPDVTGTDALKSIAGIFSLLRDEGYSVKLTSFSAIDRYLGLPALPYVWAETNAGIAVLARFIDNLRFPGVEVADAAADASDGTCYFRCLDLDIGEQNGHGEKSVSYPVLSFGYDWQTHHFLDPLGVYPLLRNLLRKTPRKNDDEGKLLSVFAAAPVRLTNHRDAAKWRRIMDTALIFARYGIPDKVFEPAANAPHEPLPSPEHQRSFLSCLLVSPEPQRGFEFLKQSGFLKAMWQELESFDDVDHSKEFHPEGNGWNHTMETFRHRKPASGGGFDLSLSLGLLLHDAGKPVSASVGNHRFEGHAELGAKTAAAFLKRLEFPQPLIEDVFYLVKNHMLPAALKRLPLTKTSEIMASPLFPTLMELYRCDESSSFKGLDAYYENSAAYQAYLRNMKNPYRYADGRKVGKSDRRRLFDKSDKKA